VLRVFGAAKSSQILGVDISSTTVKLLELSRHGEAYRVESFAVAPLPPEAVVEKNINEIETVGATVEGVIARSGTMARRVAAAVSGSSVIIKTITAPEGLSEEDLEAQLTLEIDQYIPYSLDEVAIDFEVLGPAPGRPEEIEVRLVACRQETIDSRVETLEVAGLKPTVMDVEVFALGRSLKLLSSQMPSLETQRVAMIDIGASMMTLSVFVDGESLYTREQLFGGRQLTDEIMSRYDLTYEEAGRAKKRGGLPEDYERDVLGPFCDATVQQISRSLQLFFSSSEHASLDQIVLCGGVASIHGLSTLVEERLSIPTVVADPFANMSISPTVDAQALREDAPALMVACGLAMRRPC
jgi:type IV pilus assembly protein PilM